MIRPPRTARPHVDSAAGAADDARVRPTRRALLGLGGAGLGALVLSACSAKEDDLAQQANAGGDTGYIAGDGSVSEYPEEDRSDPVDFEGALFDGTEVTGEQLRGKPVLLNFWYAGCAPCRKEAPDLVELAQDFEDRVAFYGVNVRDEQATAEAFERTFEIPYPSFEDRDGGVLLDLSKHVPPQAVPTTLVLDSQGRVAARILGIADPSILRTVLDDVTSA